MAFLLAGALALEQAQQQASQHSADNAEQTDDQGATPTDSKDAMTRVQTLLQACRTAAAKYSPLQADGALEYCMLLVRVGKSAWVLRACGVLCGLYTCDHATTVLPCDNAQYSPSVPITHSQQQEFETAVLNGDTAEQLAVIQRMEALTGVHTQTLLRCANTLKRHHSICHEMITAVYNAAMTIEMRLAEPRMTVAAAV